MFNSAWKQDLVHDQDWSSGGLHSEFSSQGIMWKYVL